MAGPACLPFSFPFLKRKNKKKDEGTEKDGNGIALALENNGINSEPSVFPVKKEKKKWKSFFGRRKKDEGTKKEICQAVNLQVEGANAKEEKKKKHLSNPLSRFARKKAAENTICSEEQGQNFSNKCLCFPCFHFHDPIEEEIKANKVDEDIAENLSCFEHEVPNDNPSLEAETEVHAESEKNSSTDVIIVEDEVDLLEEKCSDDSRLSFPSQLNITDEVFEVNTEEFDFQSSLSSLSIDLNLINSYEIVGEEEEIEFFSCPSSPSFESYIADNFEQNGEEGQDLSHPIEQIILEEPYEKTDSPSRFFSFFSSFVGLRFMKSKPDSFSHSDSFPFSSSVVGAGLANLGNTCYMNSVLQCMMRTEELVKKLYSNSTYNHECNKNEQFCTVCEFKNLIQECVENSGSEYSPLNFASQLRNFSKDFTLGHPADAQEYLRCFLDKLETSSQNEVVHQVFGGQFISQLKCTKCSQSSHSFEPFLDISLQIDKSVKSIEQSLQSYIQSELLKASCQWCKETGSEMEKNILISRAPDVLTLHLKRVDRFGRKNDSEVAYPLELDFGPFILPSGSHVETKYELYALIDHDGPPQFGHYRSLVRSSGSWYKFSDVHVKRTTEQEAASMYKSAYLLFYKRKDQIPSPPQKFHSAQTT